VACRSLSFPKRARSLGGSYEILILLQHYSPSRQLEHTLDALLGSALREFDSDPVALRLRLCSALSQTQPHASSHALVLALLAKSIAVDDSSCALAVLDAGLKHDPDNTALWSQFWAVLLQSDQAQSFEPYQSLLRQRLPFVSDAAELRIMLELFKHPTAYNRINHPCNSLINTAANKQINKQIISLGYCRWDGVRQVVRGWALDLNQPQSPCRLTLRAGSLASQGQLIADAPVDLLQSAGISSVGGFTIRLPKPVDALEIFFEDGSPLIGSPLGCLPSMLLNQADRHPESFLRTEFNATSTTRSVSPFFPNKSLNQVSTVDVLVPVYEGREAAITCIESLLRSKGLQRTPHEIVVLDDASNDAVLVSRLQAWAQQGLLTLVQRPANLGFIRNMNRGMAMHPDRDVVWLNADTRVTGNWLDRLRDAAYTDEHTATATPWSNEGEFMTLAGKHRGEPLPAELEQAVLDQLLSDLNLAPVELVSGCGFCFYVKREAIEAVGWLDEIDLTEGYGEETDWCMRARALGWQHVAATNLFVGHQGGQSFGLRKRMLAHRNNAIIRMRYPLAERLHRDYLRQDPLRHARETIARSRWQQWLNRLQAQSSTISNSLVIKRVLTLDSSKDLSDEAMQLTLSWLMSAADSQRHLRLQLSVNVIKPVIQLNYCLPLDANQLTEDLIALCQATLQSTSQAASQASQLAIPQLTPQSMTWESSDELPPLLTDCLDRALLARKVLKPSSTPHKLSPDISSAAVITSAAPQPSVLNKNKPAARRHGLNVEVDDSKPGLALIVDDLRDSSMVDHWLKNIRRLRQSDQGKSVGLCFVATQNTPGTQLLRRAGLVAPVHCPEGMAWKQWLGLLGVNAAVTLGANPTLTNHLTQELGVELPIMSFEDWISERIGICSKPTRARRSRELVKTR